ncbi:MAG: hypothetical protein PHW63_09865 [Alphaproteobacteria bacterium]|nr:hypothetical protein [Alphaproteobacteria bacterium]
MTTNKERKWPAGTADKINEWAESQLGLSLEPWQMDLLRQAEVPQPRTLADMTREEREACQWMQADFDHSFADPPIRVVITKARKTTADIILPEGAVSCVHPDSLTPLPGLPRMVWPKDTPEVEEGLYGQALWDMFMKAIRDEKEYHIDAQDYEGVKRWRDAERALRTALETNPPKEALDPPRPEDGPEPEPGQAWLIDYKGTHYEAVYWYSPLHAHWSFTTSREGLTTIDSYDATPVSRLVPEDKV